ncbi:pyrophosphatase [Parvibium lacunae]|uniref:Pyrophosphatase n=1 Tax=Parvibium lacunae TaxID=1888893 RepID=A0A368L2W0_9BURK|nr:pyrophosphatase [Parvibium lacunae]RCS57448.1 pyrophosphatase [Parvibium lacunae]
MSQFADDIQKFNQIYRLPVNTRPTLAVGVPVIERLQAFKAILQEELTEVEEILEVARSLEQPAVAADDATRTKTELALLTMLADWLGDIQVYCASEMAKFGLPLDAVLSIIMQSNFSKLDANGQPIYDERGKVLKGPDYWRPEPALSQLLAQKQQNENGA